MSNVSESKFNVTSDFEEAVSTTVASLNFTNISDTAAVSLVEFSWMPSTDTCIYIYIAFVVLIIILTVMAALCLFTMCMRASVRLHDAMFSCIIRTKMAFFTKYPSGNYLILNLKK